MYTRQELQQLSLSPSRTENLLIPQLGGSYQGFIDMVIYPTHIIYTQRYSRQVKRQ